MLQNQKKNMKQIELQKFSYFLNDNCVKIKQDVEWYNLHNKEKIILIWYLSGQFLWWFLAMY